MDLDEGHIVCPSGRASFALGKVKFSTGILYLFIDYNLLDLASVQQSK